eukprot:gb/GECH01009856.1/.p1 GENE.gb/GECH01009856.1/~~gb/GECH01009856.1/.p1  ORF type:complete len:1270 (+),score=336.42 gb/GECH01009856.1/:1-3810(+)
MPSDSVRVAVRVRPFNEREKKAGANCVVEMEGPNTTITNPENGQKKTFTYDFSYDSFNGVATQQNVFEDLGKDVLENAWEGFNCSLFAYGQTGSGKSYSMVGYGEDKGIIPLSCEEMFNRISSNDDPLVEYTVECSMLEIYNEKIRDLFNPKKGKDLKVREDPKIGVYVEGLKSVTVKNYEEIANLLEQGNNVKTVASTNMNQSSSRAHTLFQIAFQRKQLDRESKHAQVLTSKIVLVDLAGSERSTKTGAEGDRFKEGIAINKSLSALGNCISALSEASSKKKKAHVPYRDSVLTRMLKESLGGNSKTIMIAALSPADINFEETLSTLRYASRAKQIKTNAKKNEDSKVKMIKELQAEVERLRSLTQGKADPGQDNEKGLKDELEEKMKVIEEMQKSQEQKERESEEIMKNLQQAQSLGLTGDPKTTPHLVNLNEDPLMSERLIYFLHEGKTMIGRSNKGSQPDIELSGLRISAEHCHITNENNENIIIEPINESKVFINGKKATGPTNLSQGCRIILGNHHVFRFNNPQEAARLREQRENKEGDDQPNEIVDYFFAQRELAEAQGLTPNIRNDKREKELEEKLKQMEEKMKKQREAEESERKEFEEKHQKLTGQMKEREQELQRQLESGNLSSSKVKELEDQLQSERDRLENEKEEARQKQQELEERLRQQEEEAQQMAKKKRKEEREMKLLEDRLLSTIPLVNDANSMAAELGRDSIHFEIKLMADVHHGVSTDDEEGSFKRALIGVQVTDEQSGAEVMWEYDEFLYKVEELRELYNNTIEALDAGEEYEPNEDEDPLTDLDDKTRAQRIGLSVVYLKSLAFSLDQDIETPILNLGGRSFGELTVRIAPCSPSGDEDNVDYVEDPDDLIGKQFHFKIKIMRAKNIPKEYCTNVHARYKFFFDEEWTTSEEYQKETTNPEIGFEKMYNIEHVTEDMVRYFNEDPLTIELWGYPASKQNTRPHASRPIQSEIAKLQQENTELIRKLDHMNSKQENSSREKDAMDSAVKALEQREQQLTDERDGLHDRVQKLSEKNQSMQEEIQNAQNIRNDMETKVKELELERRQLKDKAEQLESRTGQNEKASQELNNKISDLEKERDELHRDLNEAEIRVDQLKKENELLSQQISGEAKNALEDLRKEAETQRSLQREAVQREQAARRELDEYKKDLKKLEEEKEELHKRHDDQERIKAEREELSQKNVHLKHESKRLEMRIQHLEAELDNEINKSVHQEITAARGAAELKGDKQDGNAPQSKRKKGKKSSTCIIQ